MENDQQTEKTEILRESVYFFCKLHKKSFIVQKNGLVCIHIQNTHFHYLSHVSKF